MSQGRQASSQGRPSYAGVLISILLVGSVLGLRWVNWLSPVDAIAQDAFVRLTPDASQASDHVLLITFDEDTGTPSGTEWTSWIEQVLSMSPKAVGFTFTPESLPSEVYELAAKSGRVTFGLRLTHRATRGEPERFESIPSDADRWRELFSLTTVPPAQHGVHREQWLTRLGQEFPVLEARLVDLAGGELAEDENRFSVNFLSGRWHIPSISATRITEDDLVDGIIRDRVILIGYERSLDRPGLHTPITSDDEMMSDLEYHGYAVNTLLEQSPIRTLGFPIVSVMLIIQALLALFAYQLFGMRNATWYTLGFLGVVAIVCGSTLALFHTWIPFGDIAVLQIGAFVIHLRHRAVREDRTLRRMVLDTSARLHRKVVPTSFYASEEHWDQIAALVMQTLRLERTIFLERVEGDHRVREVASVNCSLEEITEQRRDYERTPYSTAIEASATIPVQKYLAVRENDQQYLTPLIFGGEVMGFWSFSVDTRQKSDEGRFKAALREFSAQISEMLYARKARRDREARESGLLEQVVNMERAFQPYNTLNRLVTVLDRRLSSLQHLFDGLGTAAILYDLFGRVVQVNRRMSDTLNRMEMAAFDMSALDFLVQVAGLPRERGLELMHYIIFERGVVTLPARSLQQGAESMVLRMHALAHDEDSQLDEDEFRPFELHGILCELIDVSELRHLFQVRERVMQQLSTKLRGHLEAVTLAAEAGSATDLSAEDRDRATSVLKEKMKDINKDLAELEHHLQHDVSEDIGALYPVDGQQIVNNAVHGVEAAAEKKEVAVRVDAADFLNLVYASPRELEELAGSILRVLIDDAVEQSELVVELREDDEGLRATFSNKGFGIPDEQLQSLLVGDQQIVSTDFRKIRSGIDRITYWGGHLEASSTLGTGTRFTLRLKSFHP